jgi:hypothetical protein
MPADRQKVQALLQLPGACLRAVLQLFADAADYLTPS